LSPSFWMGTLMSWKNAKDEAS